MEYFNLFNEFLKWYLIFAPIVKFICHALKSNYVSCLTDVAEATIDFALVGAIDYMVAQQI